MHVIGTCGVCRLAGPEHGLQAGLTWLVGSMAQQRHVDRPATGPPETTVAETRQKTTWIAVNQFADLAPPLTDLVISYLYFGHVFEIDRAVARAGVGELRRQRVKAAEEQKRARTNIPSAERERTHEQKNIPNVNGQLRRLETQRGVPGPTKPHLTELV
jgi:hypothetical protein